MLRYDSVEEKYFEVKSYDSWAASSNEDWSDPESAEDLDEEPVACFSTSWSDLEPDLLGRCFEQLDALGVDETERACILPLVCKHWRDVDKSHPPVVTQILVSRLPVLPSQVDWFRRVAPNVEELIVKLTRERTWGPAGLIQMLEAAAISAPRLETCIMGQGSAQFKQEQICDRPLIRAALFSLTQLKELHLSRWSFADYSCCEISNLREINHLSNLRQLEVLKVGALSIEGRDGAQQASLFWAVLSRLPQLHKVKIKALEIPDDLSMIEDECFGNNAALCTQIRYLHLPDLQDFDLLDPVNRLASMTQLTRLTLRTPFPSSYFAAFLDFPLLADLDLTLDMAWQDHAPVVGNQPLTRLCLRKEAKEDQRYPYDLLDMMPPDAPGMASLKCLQLRLMTLRSLPVACMKAMTGLTYLHLSPLAPGLDFGGALSALPSLQELSVSRRMAAEYRQALTSLPAWLPNFKLLEVR